MVAAGTGTHAELARSNRGMAPTGPTILRSMMSYVRYMSLVALIMGFIFSDCTIITLGLSAPGRAPERGGPSASSVTVIDLSQQAALEISPGQLAESVRKTRGECKLDCVSFRVQGVRILIPR